MGKRMAILRSKTGDLYTSLKSMNDLVAPNRIGSFSIPSKALELVQEPLNEKTGIEIYHYIPKELDAACGKWELIPTKAFTIVDEANEKFKLSKTPHINNWGEAHFIFAGALIIYLNMPPLFALLLQPGDWFYNQGMTEHWVKLTKERFCTLASYHAAPIHPTDEFHKRRVFTKSVADFSIL